MAAMLGPHAFLLVGSLLEIPHLTPKTDKGTVVNLYLQMGAKDS
jgi:hypothetical protein